MGLPHRDVQKRRLKRLQNEQNGAVSNASSILNKNTSGQNDSCKNIKNPEHSSKTRKNNQGFKESIGKMSTVVIEVPKVSSKDSSDAVEEANYGDKRGSHMQSQLSKNSLSSESTIKDQCELQKSRYINLSNLSV